MLAFQGAAAETILSLIEYAPGLYPLANSICQQSQDHENDPAQPSWVSSQPGLDWRTGQPAGPIYVNLAGTDFTGVELTTTILPHR